MADQDKVSGSLASKPMEFTKNEVPRTEREKARRGVLYTVLPIMLFFSLLDLNVWGLYVEADSFVQRHQDELKEYQAKYDAISPLLTPEQKPRMETPLIQMRNELESKRGMALSAKEAAIALIIMPIICLGLYLLALNAPFAASGIIFAITLLSCVANFIQWGTYAKRGDELPLRLMGAWICALLFAGACLRFGLRWRALSIQHEKEMC